MFLTWGGPIFLPAWTYLLVMLPHKYYCMMFFFFYYNLASTANIQQARMKANIPKLFVVFKGKLRFISRVPSATHLPLQQFGKKAIKITIMV